MVWKIYEGVRKTLGKITCTKEDFENILTYVVNCAENFVEEEYSRDAMEQLNKAVDMLKEKIVWEE